MKELIHKLLFSFRYWYAISIVVLLLFAPRAVFAADFWITTRDSNKDNKCEYLTIKDNKISCFDEGANIIYPAEMIVNITIHNNGQKGSFDQITDKLIKVVNTLSEAKRQEIISRKQQIAYEIAQKEADMKRKEKEANDKFNVTMARCERECEVTKYSYNKVCYQGCITQHMMYGSN